MTGALKLELGQSWADDLHGDLPPPPVPEPLDLARLYAEYAQSKAFTGQVPQPPNPWGAPSAGGLVSNGSPAADFSPPEELRPALYVQPPRVPPFAEPPHRANLTPDEAALAATDPFARLVADALERAVPQSGRVLQAHQIPPRVHDDPLSTVKGWVMMAGRNAGKSYAGARWLNRVCSVPGKPKRARIIAPSFGDAVASCVEGPSGILEASSNQAVWKPSHPGGAQVQWPNGSVCYVIGTPTPRDVDRLRAIGNIDYDWFEEAAANPQLKEAERQARLSRRRLGSKWICTTTPKPLPEIRAWQSDESIRISQATAYDNPYADPLWLEELETMYAGTLLYQQEVLGKVLEDVAGAIWNLGRLERSRVFVTGGQTAAEAIEAAGFQIVKCAIGVDPANSSGLTGIVAVALANRAPLFAGGKPTRHLLVLEDSSMSGMSAEAWAAEAVRLAYRYDAPIVPENDSGGDAIRAVLKAADHLDRVSIFPARARGRGSKEVRAEPVAILWERDDYRGHMVGNDMPLLEEQMTTWVPDDKRTAGPTGSPDRVDALVWACTYLWTRSGVEDLEMHLPTHTSGARQNPLATRPGPGGMMPWSRVPRHRKEPAGSSRPAD